jgi:hypothetical protein
MTEESRLNSWQEKGIFVFSVVFRTALCPPSLLHKWELRAVSLGIEWQGHELYHLPPTSAKAKKANFHTSSWNSAKLSAGITLYLYLLFLIMLDTY